MLIPTYKCSPHQDRTTDPIRLLYYMSRKQITISGVKYQIKYKIGQGMQGSVYCIQDPQGQMLALKRMNVLNGHSRERLYKEISLHHSCKCDNIIKIIDSEEIDGELFVILELGECNLGTYLQTKEGNTLDEKEFLMLIKDISKGLAQIHRNDIAHRDIKADNIILKQNRFKISDFGVSGEGSSMKTFIGTPIYLAPEIIGNQYNDNSNYNHLVDVWALGVLSIEAYFGVHPFYHNPVYKSQMNFEDLKSSINQLLMHKTFTIESLIQKLKSEGQGPKAREMEKKLQLTSLNALQLLRVFWSKVLTINPSARISAKGIHDMFQSVNRTGLFSQNISHQYNPVKATNPNNSFYNPQTQSPSKPHPGIIRTQSYNTNYGSVASLTVIPNSPWNAPVLDSQEDIKCRPTMGDIATFVNNTKVIILQTSSTFNMLMSLKQIQCLSSSLTALDIAMVHYVDQGYLVGETNKLFQKMSKPDRQKCITKTLQDAAIAFLELALQYQQPIIAQVVLRLQIIAILPMLTHKFSKFMSAFPQLFPMHIGLGEFQSNGHRIHPLNLQVLLDRLRNL